MNSPPGHANFKRGHGAVIITAQTKTLRVFNYNGNAFVNRYASLYFVACIEQTDNELIVLDIIHHFVEVLDRYFSNVCELDLIFNFH